MAYENSWPMKIHGHGPWLLRLQVLLLVDTPAAGRICDHILNDTILQTPKGSFTIRESFTCRASSRIYCISSHRCPAIYIGETGRTLRERFGEHLKSITKSAPGSEDDIQVRDMKLCGENKQWKRQEMRLIFPTWYLSTIQP